MRPRGRARGPGPQGAEPQPAPLRQRGNLPVRPRHGEQTRPHGQRFGARKRLHGHGAEFRERHGRQDRRGIHSRNAARQRVVRPFAAAGFRQVRHRGLRAHRHA